MSALAHVTPATILTQTAEAVQSAVHVQRGLRICLHQCPGCVPGKIM